MPDVAQFVAEQVINEHHELFQAVPLWHRNGLRRYLEGIRPGRFLAACLEGNYHDAILHADPAALTALPAIVRFIDAAVPVYAHGSPGAVRDWLSTF